MLFPKDRYDTPGELLTSLQHLFYRERAMLSHSSSVTQRKQQAAAIMKEIHGHGTTTPLRPERSRALARPLPDALAGLSASAPRALCQGRAGAPGRGSLWPLIPL